MTTLTFCEGCNTVPITDVTKHKIYITFCKPCGRGQRAAANPDGGKVKNRTTTSGHTLYLNDRGTWVAEGDERWAIRKESGRFTLYANGVPVDGIKKTTLSSCMYYLDSYFDDPVNLLKGQNYQFGRYPRTLRVATDYVGQWIEFDVLGTREDQPFPKSKLNEDIGRLWNKKDAQAYRTLQDLIDSAQSSYSYWPALR